MMLLSRGSAAAAATATAATPTSLPAQEAREARQHAPKGSVGPPSANVGQMILRGKLSNAPSHTARCCICPVQARENVRNERLRHAIVLSAALREQPPNQRWRRRRKGNCFCDARCKCICFRFLQVGPPSDRCGKRHYG